MKTKINIFDLCWCKLYLHAQDKDIGFYFFNASWWMTGIIGMYLAGLFFIFPRAIGLYKYPKISYLSVLIGLSIIATFFLIRYGNKDVRTNKLSEYKKYKNENPLKTNVRFWVFITIPIAICIVSFAIMNIRYALSNAV